MSNEFLDKGDHSCGLCGCTVLKGNDFRCLNKRCKRYRFFDDDVPAFDPEQHMSPKEFEKLQKDLEDLYGIDVPASRRMKRMEPGELILKDYYDILIDEIRALPEYTGRQKK